MKRPLETHFIQNVRYGLQTGKGMLTVLILFLAFNLSHGQTISRTECNCLNNATTDSDGQYGEQITVLSSPGEIWTLTEVDGLFQATSPAPPAAPIPFPADYELTSSGTGVYTLDAIRLDGTAWSVVISNGTTSFPITSAHVCNSPSNIVLGDFGTCIGTIESYEVDLPASQIENISWSISGGGNLVGGQGTRKIFVDWGDAVGDYDVSFVGAAYSYDGQFTNSCAFSGSGSVAVMDEEAFSMACNNQLNISLNGLCELDFVADMILEDMMFSNDSYDLEFTDVETGEEVVGPTLGMEYVGTTLQVKVIHECSGNSCWGLVLLEDKSIPQLECGPDVTLDCDELMTPNITGFPVGPDVVVTNLGNDVFRLEGFDLCSDVELRFDDIPLDTDLCDGPYSSIIRRSWVATDVAGNTTTCSQLININRATLDDITFPENYDDVLGPNPSLVACGNFPMLANGNPDPDYTGRPMGVFCLNVKVDYEDVRLPICGDNAYKLRRRWRILNHCDGQTIERTQNITVMDNDAPVCVAPPEFTVSASPITCSPIIEVPAPIIVFECSEWDYEVSYKLADENGDPFFQPTNEGVVRQGDGTYLISGLDDINGDMIWITYYIRDECDNLSTCFTEVTIIDTEQPIPVCDLHTFVGLNEDGIGYASIESFDDGSYDNCSEITREVRRVDNFGCGETSQWSNKVKFCCEDVGNIIMVQMRVTDESGNSNICMVEAEVQDNHAPTITFCPADITIDCDDDTVNLDQYGTAVAEDNCNVTITSTAQRSINSCGTGVITRRFIATDGQGNTDDCIQRIRVSALDPFYINPNNPNDPSDDIIWPGSHTILNGCAESGVNPDDLPAGKQRPVVVDEGCSQISFTYNDVIFQYTEEACAKILRTWKVIDDCVYVPFSNVGVWTYTQVIKVENSTAPNFITGCTAGDFTITNLSSCTARIQGTATAIDDCTSTEDLEYSYRIDVGNNGSIDFEGNGNSINREVSFGTHRVLWTVEDECGNIRNCASIITVQDIKAPTPYCLSEVVTVVMETSGQVTIWANDFDLGSFDNCTSQENLRISFSSNTNDTNRTFTCDSLSGTSTSFDINMYVTDEAGNSDFCMTTLVIQDNQGNCPDNATGGGDPLERAQLGGNIFNDENVNLENIEVSLSANLPEFPRTAMTDENGGYVFNELIKNESYMVSPSHDIDYNEGVSTLDLVLIQRHLLGLASFDNPYKVIAADINNSESITASDLLQLRKLILGIYTELPSNDSWRFVDAAAEFSDINDPFPFAEDMMMNEFAEDYMDADFVAVKIGDVNSSATTNLQSKGEASSRSVASLLVEDTYLDKGVQAVEVSLDEIADVYGMQFSIEVNQDMIGDINLASEEIEITQDNYTMEHGTLMASIHNANSNIITDRIFTIILNVKKAGYLSEMISMNSDDMIDEIYTEAGAEVVSTKINLEITNRSEAAHNFELLQNVPNPFNTSTDIGFVLPSDQEVSLRIFDATGKVLVNKIGMYQKGFNSITLDVREINATGVLYYQLDTEGHTASKKMIIIK